MPLTFNNQDTEDVISTPFVCEESGEIEPREGGCHKYK